jgi:hypothetical protein
MAPHPFSLRARQLSTTAGSVIISTTYQDANDSLPPGEVAGIVLGAVGGFLLLLWLLYTIFGDGSFAFAQDGSGWIDSRLDNHSGEEVDIVVGRDRGRERRRSRSRSRSRRVSDREHIEVRRTRDVSRGTSVPRAPLAPQMVERARSRATIRAVSVARSEETRPGDDEVIVIEESSPRRSRRREDRLESGYRPVDPMAYGGGQEKLREVRRSRRSSGR